VNLLKLCLFCPFDKVRCVPRNLRKTVRPKTLMASKGRWNGTCHISCFNFFQFSFGGRQAVYQIKEWKCWILFILLSNDTNRGFKGKVDLNKKLAQKVHLSFNFIYSYMNCRKCVIKSCPWLFFGARLTTNF